MPKKKTGKKVSFKDRKTGLVIFGIFHIIIGAFCALFMLLIGALALRPPGETTGAVMSIGQVILSLSLFLLIAIWFVWMGIGSILARKWARALILITSWFWLIGGLLGLIFSLLFIPAKFESLTEGEALPGIVTAFLVLIFIVIPGAFVFFYGSRHVKATCEQRDRQKSWTDKAPLPVIALSSILGCTAISMPLMGFHRWTAHFFGLFFSGIPGAAIIFIYTLLFAYAAWGTYKLQLRAWWCGLLATIALEVSWITTFSHVGLKELYEKMGVPPEHPEMIQRLDQLLHDPKVLILSGLGAVTYLLFIIYTKKFFKAASRKKR